MDLAKLLGSINKAAGFNHPVNPSFKGVSALDALDKQLGWQPPQTESQPSYISPAQIQNTQRPGPRRAAQPRSDITDTQQNMMLPTALNRIMGTINLAGAANKFGFKNRSLVQTSEPAVLPNRISPAGGEFEPHTRAINIYKRAANAPRVAGHEMLHSIYEDMPEQEKQQFLRNVNRYATPQQKQALRERISGPLYSHVGEWPEDLTQGSEHLTHEVHSYLPEDPNLHPVLRKHYERFMSQPAYASNGKQSPTWIKAAELARKYRLIPGFGDDIAGGA